MFSSEIQKIANDVQKIANNMSGGSGSSGGSSSSNGLVIPIYNMEYHGSLTITCNMTFNEIKEAIDAGQCVCAATNGGPTFTLFGHSASSIVFGWIQILPAPDRIRQTLITHDIDDSINMEVTESQLPEQSDQPLNL